MAEVGSAFVSVLPSARGFGKRLDNEVGPDVEKSGKAASKRFGSAFASGAKSAIAPALAIFGTAAIGAFFTDAVSEASDLNETLNKSSVIFGKNAAGIERFGSTAAKSLGLSKNEAIAAASGFGDMFSQIGFARNEAAKMSKDVVTLSADLGSFNNLETSDVAERISAAFRGEYDSLQALIPNINAARVEQVALATTGKKTTKELTAQEKAAAVLAIVHKDGARAAGDFERTSGGLANQQKILSAQVTDLKAKIGAALLPALTRTASYLNDKAVPAIADFVQGLQDGTGAGGKTARTIGDIYQAAKPVAATIISIVRGFAGLPGSSQKAILLAGAVFLLSQRMESLQIKTAAVIGGFQEADKKAIALRGSAIAAGAGLTILASKAGGASSDLGTLATVGAGIATGFAATGSPWGAAIGGGVSILALFGQRSASAAAAQREFDAAGKAVAATINQETGALEKNTRATAAKQLADEGAFTAGRKVGASYRDVLGAALGNEGAIKRVNAATRAYIETADGNYKATVNAAKVAGRLQGSVHAVSGEIATERLHINQVNEAMGKAKDKTVVFRVDTPGLFGTLNALGQLSSKIDSAIAKSRRAKTEIGANAAGTDNWRGGLTVVGEKGPELINLARGAQVIPNHKIGDVAAGRSVGPGSLDSMSPQAIRAALDGMSLEVELTGGDRAKAKFVQAGLKAGARL